MQDQWAQSVINISLGTQSLNGRAQLSMSTRTQACDYQCQTNAHNLQLIHLEQGHDYSLVVIKAESLYQLMYLRFICYKLKLTDVITIPTSLSILYDSDTHVTY